jgi:probable rRNA maturation factor
VSLRANSKPRLGGIPEVQLELILQFDEDGLRDEWPLSRPRLRRLILAALPASCRQARISLAVFGRSAARALNRQFRGRDYATNVLTFPYQGPPFLSADIAICLPVLLAEAASAGRRSDHHAAHLVVHGVLHACGLDHENEQDAEQMEALEVALLRRFRIPDPYLHSGDTPIT